LAAKFRSRPIGHSRSVGCTRSIWIDLSIKRARTGL